jgi:hypothetical protein
MGYMVAFIENNDKNRNQAISAPNLSMGALSMLRKLSPSFGLVRIMSVLALSTRAFASSTGTAYLQRRTPRRVVLQG